MTAKVIGVRLKADIDELGDVHRVRIDDPFEHEDEDPKKLEGYDKKGSVRIDDAPDFLKTLRQSHAVSRHSALRSGDSVFTGMLPLDPG